MDFDPLFPQLAQTWGNQEKYMPRYDIPSDEEIDFIRQQWVNDGSDGGTIHRLCDAVTELKKRLREHVPDERRTIPTPPPEGMGGLDEPFMGMSAPPAALLSMVVPVHRCAACLDEFTPHQLPARCPACGSLDVLDKDSPEWPCTKCKKLKDGMDPCICGVEIRLEDVEDDEEE